VLDVAYGSVPWLGFDGLFVDFPDADAVAMAKIWMSSALVRMPAVCQLFKMLK
jgi:hypothetical protein